MRKLMLAAANPDDRPTFLKDASGAAQDTEFAAEDGRSVQFRKAAADRWHSHTPSDGAWKLAARHKGTGSAEVCISVWPSAQAQAGSDCARLTCRAVVVSRHPHRCSSQRSGQQESAHLLWQLCLPRPPQTLRP